MRDITFFLFSNNTLFPPLPPGRLVNDVSRAPRFKRIDVRREGCGGSTKRTRAARWRCHFSVDPAGSNTRAQCWRLPLITRGPLQRVPRRVKHVGPRFPYTSLILRKLRLGLATGSCRFKIFVSRSDKCVLLENKKVMSPITNT